MDFDNLFPSRFLKATDLEGSEKPMTISGVSIEDLVDGTRKPAISFQETDRLLVLNKTNGLALATGFGKNTDQWIGKRVILFSTPVSFQNKLVDALRIKIPPIKPAAPVTAGEEDFNDDIEF